VRVIVGTLAIIGVLSLIVWTALIVWAITASGPLERDRLERQAAEASWQIHRHATMAFAQMLEAGREAQRPERPT
jgi:hypothetical protein